MLETVLNYLNNYFVKDSIKGTFKIEGGILVAPALNGQYIKINGSVLNDGVYQYPVTTLNDETFEGEIELLAIPTHLLDVVSKIDDYVTKYPETPYQSESFGGYSYNKGSNAGGSEDSSSWRVVFRSELRKYKRLLFN